MQILGRLVMCFDGAVVFFKSFSLLFRLVLAILCFTSATHNIHILTGTEF